MKTLDQQVKELKERRDSILGMLYGELGNSQIDFLDEALKLQKTIYVLTGLAEEKGILKSLRRVIDYVYNDECKNYEESEESARNKHIFNDIYILDEWLKKQVKK